MQGSHLVEEAGQGATGHSWAGGAETNTLLSAQPCPLQDWALGRAEPGGGASPLLTPQLPAPGTLLAAWQVPHTYWQPPSGEDWPNPWFLSPWHPPSEHSPSLLPSSPMWRCQLSQVPCEGPEDAGGLDSSCGISLPPWDVFSSWDSAPRHAHAWCSHVLVCQSQAPTTFSSPSGRWSGASVCSSCRVRGTLWGAGD